MAVRTLARFRLSIAAILFFTAMVGLSLGALSRPSYWWLALIQSTVVISVAVCAAIAIAGRNARDRAFTLAFIAAVLINTYLGFPGPPIADLVQRSLPYGHDTFTGDQAILFSLTLTPVISLLLGVICGWIAASMATAEENDGPRS